MFTKETACIECEKTLRSKRDYNTINNVWHRETEVIDRLIERKNELSSSYLEICEKLPPDTPAFGDFWGILLSVAAIWHPSELRKYRDMKKQLQSINEDISLKASELSDLLEKRSHIENTGPFGSNTHYHIVDVIDEACAENYRYISWVKDKLDALHKQFDMKYWPTLTDIMRVLSMDAYRAEVTPHDPITEASTASSRNSKSEFFRAFWAAVHEQSQANFGRIPNDFRLSDETIASLGNCALDLGPEQIVDGPYIKRLRQRDRDALII
ncbi:hypothetical protein Q4560_15700 [Celeribacter halophilus]|uniref:Uncharacterized protein n=1 Tax=Celeribacter halophilus TaxID=576117 RepID=A0AAW7XWW2_9RHOB|nr:hypothetical protein [Celeribacter halophilus]MDO6458966.1 hypothetical protein [Celeribacter halophilus]MDO6724716.1 hypothetical protein [Celeribacter halophilus]